MNNFQKVFKNTFFLILSEFFLKAIGIFWVIFLARNLSISEYGRYNLVNSFISIFSFLPDFGIGLVAIREIAKRPSKTNLFLNVVFVLNLFFSLLCLLLIFLFSVILNYSLSLKILIAIAAFSLVVSSFRSVAIIYFEGKEKMEISGLITSLSSLVLIAAALAGLKLFGRLEGVFWGMLVGNIFSFFLTWNFFLKNKISLRIKISSEKISIAKYFIHEAWPLGLAGLFALFYTRIDSLVLEKILGDEQVGIYGSATPFVFSLIQLLNVPFVVAVYPALSRLSVQKDRRRFLNSVVKSLFLIVAWSFPLAFLVRSFSPVILPLIFGQKYVKGISVLKILIFFVPFASLSAFLYKVLLVIGKQKVYLLVSFLGAIFSLIFNLIFIPRFQILGAAYASVLTQLVLFLIYFSYVFLRVFNK